MAWDGRRRVGSPAHTRSVLRDFHRAWVEARKAELADGVTFDDQDPIDTNYEED